MADLENKNNENLPEKVEAKKTNKPAKAAKKKDKPGFFKRIGDYFRGLKSEAKKVVWCPWGQVRKNTLVVIVVIAVSAAAIGILDYAFSQGLIALGSLF